MTDTVLFDKLLQLRLPAFREGLREQQANPQYAELSFEERLALLVDQECTRATTTASAAPCSMAAFPIQAALEDLDLSPARGLDRSQILELEPVRLDRQPSEYSGAGSNRIWKIFRCLFAWDCRRSTGLFGALLPHLPPAPHPRADPPGGRLSQSAALPGPHRSAHPG